ncbi:hypothetical protein KC902_03695 [Candidatus Kaiserbacteria bacterium]|nr:hypothetical protein [Candidatus Kaiserbacteria bacterium]USN88784.1 MAG: hypothetical protein H6780_04840 [Candidatus Nomurabacteria bacterium]
MKSFENSFPPNHTQKLLDDISSLKRQIDGCNLSSDIDGARELAGRLAELQSELEELRKADHEKTRLFDEESKAIDYERKEWEATREKNHLENTLPYDPNEVDAILTDMNRESEYPEAIPPTVRTLNTTEEEIAEARAKINRQIKEMKAERY